MIPIFSTALANSSGSTVPLLFKSKYLKALRRTVSSLVAPEAFWESFCFRPFSKLHESNKNDHPLSMLWDVQARIWPRTSTPNSYLPRFKSLHCVCFDSSVSQILFVIIKALKEWMILKHLNANLLISSKQKIKVRTLLLSHILKYTVKIH